MRHNRRDGGEWPACYGRRCNDLPRPILIFVAAKENGPAYGSRCGNEFPRPILILNGDLIVKRTAEQFPAVLIL